jgi:hypothetical protein
MSILMRFLYSFFRFVEAFKRVSINGQKLLFEYGGLPQKIFFHNQCHYIGFTGLPAGITPGFATVANMEGDRLPTPPREEIQVPMVPEKAVPREPEGHSPALPMVGAAKGKKIEKTTAAPEPRKIPLSRSILNTKPRKIFKILTCIKTLLMCHIFRA